LPSFFIDTQAHKGTNLNVVIFHLDAVLKYNDSLVKIPMALDHEHNKQIGIITGVMPDLSWWGKLLLIFNLS